MLFAATALGSTSMAQCRGAAELDCSALAVYWEARGEGKESQHAIAHVILSRVADEGFPNTICGVVEQSREFPAGSCQLSWWCDGRRDEPREREAWDRAKRIARDALLQPEDDPTRGALYYHTKSVKPEWRRDHGVVAQVGRHLFYARSAN